MSMEIPRSSFLRMPNCHFSLASRAARTCLDATLAEPAKRRSEAKPPHFLPKCCARDAKQCGRLYNLAACPPDRFLDVQAFRAFPRFSQARHSVFRLVRQRSFGENRPWRNLRAPSDVPIALSMRLRSSRIFPGQSWSRNAAFAAGARLGTRWPALRAN